MLDRLPRLLTRGVTATRDGLVVDNDAIDEIIGATLEWPAWERLNGMAGRLASWPNAAERLRYREGEPWCMEHEYGYIACHRPGAEIFEGEEERVLHRLAAILCDGAEAFRVLHWCVTELGGSGE